MTFAIPDLFTDPLGRLIDWDTTVDDDSLKGFMATNQHVNLRTFKPVGLSGLPQASLEAVFESVLEAEKQFQMETQNVPAPEPWVLAGTGLNAITVGAIAARNNWAGLTTTANGAAVAADLTSALGAIDISSQDVLSIVFPDFNAFDLGTSYIQLCSNASGNFSSNTSAQVLFTANTSTLPELRVPLSSFAQAGFALNSVTGVKIHLVKAAGITNGTAVTVMAIRALKSSWTYNQIDIDTRTHAVVLPPTLNGNAPGGGTTPIPLIRGLGTKDDPIPADIALNLFFGSGAQATRVATGANFNHVDLYFRELKSLGTVKGSWITARLRWNSTGTFFDTFRTDYNSGAYTFTTTYTQNLSTILDQMNNTGPGRYMFRVELLGTTITAQLWNTDASMNIGTQVWKSSPVTYPDYIYRNGRVGFGVSFLDRDAFVAQIASATRGYATLQTQTYTSATPVDGAQIVASYSSDDNLFSNFSGSDIVVDPTKTLSGLGSWRSQFSLTSNQFNVDDWTATYLDLDLWVGSNLTAQNAPRFSLIGGTTTYPIFTPTLLPLQWNHLSIPLDQMIAQLTGIGYQLYIAPPVSISTALGYFYADNVKIGRRTVRLSARATSTGLWRDLRGLDGEATGAVHFIGGERGTQLQIQAEALTPDAWIAQLDTQPRYAGMGNFIFDHAFRTQ